MFPLIMAAFHFAFSWCRKLIRKQLCSQFHLLVVNCREHPYRTIAVTLQQTQKLSFGAQTKQRLVLVHEVHDGLDALIIGTNLKRNNTLTACRQENFGWKNPAEKLAVFERDFVPSR